MSNSNDSLAAGRQLRELLLVRERWLTSDGVATLMRVDVNPENYTRDLRSRREIIGVQHLGRYLHPAVQFNVSGTTLPRLRELAEILPDSLEPWGGIFWLFQSTGRLGGRRPADLFAMDPQAVIEAARLDFQGNKENW